MLWRNTNFLGIKEKDCRARANNSQFLHITEDIYCRNDFTKCKFEDIIKENNEIIKQLVSSI